MPTKLRTLLMEHHAKITDVADPNFLIEMFEKYEYMSSGTVYIYFKVYDYYIKIHSQNVIQNRRNYCLIEPIINDKKRIDLLVAVTNNKDILSNQNIITLVKKLTEQEVDKLLEIFEFFNQLNIKSKLYEEKDVYFRYDLYSEVFYSSSGIDFYFDLKDKEFLNKQLLWFDLMKSIVLKLKMIEELGAV